MVMPPSLADLSPSGIPMANGFYRDESAYWEIRAERKMVRHRSNSLAAIRSIRCAPPRLLRNTA